MSSPDADARVLEQFLRTMAPPAALTAVYRQRVVRASLDARTKVLLRRQKQVMLAVCVCVSFLLVLPGALLTLAASWQSSRETTADFTAQSAVPPTASRFPIDGYELSLIEAQVHSRLQTFLAAQRAAAP